MKIWKAFTREWIEFQEPSRAMGVRKVVRMMSHRESPSIPT